MGNDQQSRVPGLTGMPHGVMKECAADSTSHRLRLNEEVDEFRIVLDRAPAGESKNLAAVIDGDADTTGCECLAVGTEDVGIGVEVRSVLGPDV